MFINREGKELPNMPNEYIQIDSGLEVESSWVVRLIKTVDTYSSQKKQCIGEEPYDHEPTLGEIKYCLAKHPGAFAVKEQIYTLEERNLPFD